jgi:hypothetical protein
MRIGILGSGLMGDKLGTLVARVGHDVTFSSLVAGQEMIAPAARIRSIKD